MDGRAILVHFITPCPMHEGEGIFEQRLHTYPKSSKKSKESNSFKKTKNIIYLNRSRPKAVESSEERLSHLSFDHYSEDITTVN